MTVSPSLSAKAETLAERLGLSYDHLLGFRFAVNVLLARTNHVGSPCGKLATVRVWLVERRFSELKHIGQALPGSDGKVCKVQVLPITMIRYHTAV